MLNTSLMNHICICKASDQDPCFPKGTQLQSFEADSFVGNDLSGPPLPNNCDDPKHIPKHEHNAKEGKEEINWLYVIMPLAFVSGFWAGFVFGKSWRFTDDLVLRIKNL
ncbi:hypothetical protein K1719_024621 [Acacia pycnantha]|nr:hypothetical protein K1719_024621 [Acacia pycnantha]